MKTILFLLTAFGFLYSNSGLAEQKLPVNASDECKVTLEAKKLGLHVSADEWDKCKTDYQTVVSSETHPVVTSNQCKRDLIMIMSANEFAGWPTTVDRLYEWQVKCNVNSENLFVTKNPEWITCRATEYTYLLEDLDHKNRSLKNKEGCVEINLTQVLSLRRLTDFRNGEVRDHTRILIDMPNNETLICLDSDLVQGRQCGYLD